MPVMSVAAALNTMLWWILPVAILAGFPLMWLFVTWIISRCGWRKFAEGRECPAAPGGGISVNVLNLVFGRWASYNNATVATFTLEGVHVRTRWMMKLFHPPFFIPWDMVVSCQKRSFFRRMILPEFKVLNGNRVLYLRPSEKNYRKVESMLPERLRGVVDGD